MSNHDGTTAVIVNPAAAGGRLGREWPRLAGTLATLDGALSVRFTRRPGHATLLARDAVAAGTRRLLAAGGDGTFCEVAEGLYAAGAGELAVLPCGTGNDLARTLGIPRDFTRAARLALSGPTRRLDLIRVDGRVVVNAIGVGLTGDINRRAARVKRVRGITAYLATAVAGLLRYEPPWVRLSAPGRVYEGPMTMLAVHNGPTTGGGFRLTPGASPVDGKLDACLVPAVGVLGRVRRLVAGLRGRLGGTPGTVEVRSPWVEIEHEGPLVAHLDGNDWTFEPPTTRFEVLPGALRVVVPEHGEDAGRVS